MNNDGRISVRDFKSLINGVLMNLDRLPKLKNQRYDLIPNTKERTLRLESNPLNNNKEIIIIKSTDIESFLKEFRKLLD